MICNRCVFSCDVGKMSHTVRDGGRTRFPLMTLSNSDRTPQNRERAGSREHTARVHTEAEVHYPIHRIAL